MKHKMEELRRELSLREFLGFEMCYNLFCEFYGQEQNRTTYNLARMNMILHDVHFREFDIKHEDTLEHPQHLDKRFEAVVANPSLEIVQKLMGVLGLEINIEVKKVNK